MEIGVEETVQQTMDLDLSLLQSSASEPAPIREQSVRKNYPLKANIVALVSEHSLKEAPVSPNIWETGNLS